MAAPYYVLTSSGSLYRDGECVEKDAYGGPVALAAAGMESFVLTAKGSVYRNGDAVETHAYEAPVALAAG